MRTSPAIAALGVFAVAPVASQGIEAPRERFEQRVPASGTPPVPDLSQVPLCDMADADLDPTFAERVGCAARNLSLLEIHMGSPPGPESFGNLIVIGERRADEVGHTGPNGIPGADNGYMTTLYMR